MDVLAYLAVATLASSLQAPLEQQRLKHVGIKYEPKIKSNFAGPYEEDSR